MLWGPRLYWLGKNRWKNNWYQKMGSVCLPQIGILQYISPNKSKITFISLTGLDLQSGRGNPRYTTLVGRFWNANYNNGALSSRLSCIFLQIYPWILIFLIPAFFYLSWGCCYILQQSCPQRKGSFNSKRQLEPSKALTSCPTNQTTWIDTASGTKKKNWRNVWSDIVYKICAVYFFWFRCSYDGPFMFNMYSKIYRAGDVIIEQQVWFHGEFNLRFNRWGNAICKCEMETDTTTIC